jgi:hypothetical protein
MLFGSFPRVSCIKYLFHSSVVPLKVFISTNTSAPSSFPLWECCHNVHFFYSYLVPTERTNPNVIFIKMTYNIFFITTLYWNNHYSFSWYFFSTNVINILIFITSSVDLVGMFPHSSTSITNGRLVFYLWCYLKNCLWLLPDLWIWKNDRTQSAISQHSNNSFQNFGSTKSSPSVAFT